MKASDLVIKCLENEDVEYIFGVPGEETLDLMNSISKSSIKFILTRHEQSAAFMADAYGRLTGKAGVCIATLGPGATNLLTGIADAYLDRAPVVAITGQADLKRIHKESHQYINIVENFESVTKWNARIESPEVIPEEIRKAFKVAETEKRGPVHLELPENIASMNVEEIYTKMIPPIRARRSSPDRKSLRQAAQLIEDSKFPVILAGHGVRNTASELLLKFADLTNIPVVTTFMGKGAITAKCEHFVGTIGLLNDRLINDLFSKADLIIAIGYGLVEYAPKNWNPNLDKNIIHIDFTTSEVDINYIPEIEIISDIKETLELLAGMTSCNKRNEYVLKLRRELTETFSTEGTISCYPFRPQNILYSIRKVLADEDIFISDVGTHKFWIAKFFPVYSDSTFLMSNGFASMGFSLPSAILAKLIYPEKKVIAVSGDGGFLMNVQEIETAVRLNLNIVIVIFNDNCFNLIKWKTQKKFGTSYHVDFNNPDFVKLAESFGAIGIKLSSCGDVENVLEDAFTRDVPVIIDVEIDYKNNEILYNLL